MRLVRYETEGRAGIGAVPTEDGPVYPTPWASFEELFAEPDPLTAPPRCGSTGSSGPTGAACFPRSCTGRR